jgi:hypothetical protein
MSCAIIWWITVATLSCLHLEHELTDLFPVDGTAAEMGLPSLPLWLGMAVKHGVGDVATDATCCTLPLQKSAHGR